jgi:hypothetical protein
MVSIVSTNIKKEDFNANIFLCEQFSLLNYFWTKDFFFFFYFHFPSSLGALFFSTTNFELTMNFLHQFVWIRYMYTGIIYKDICGTRTGR